MNKYFFYVLFSTALIPSNLFAMEEEEKVCCLTSAQPTSFRPAILEQKEKYFISPTLTSIQNLRDTFKGVRQGISKEKALGMYTAAHEELTNELTLKRLANAVYLASFCNDPLEKTNASYKIFIEGIAEKNPYTLISLLGYEDIRHHMTLEVLDYLRSFNDESLSTLSRIFDSFEDDFQPSRWQKRYTISEIASAFIYAYESGLSIYVQTYLLIEAAMLNKATPISDILNLVMHSNGSVVLQAYAYSAAAMLEMGKASSQHLKPKDKGTSKTISSFMKALEYINNATALIPLGHESYGELLRNKNDMSLYLLNEKIHAIDIDALVKSIKEEAKYRKLEFSKIMFLANQAESLAQLRESLSLQTDDKSNCSSEYIMLLLRAKLEDRAYEIALTKKDHPEFHSLQSKVLWLYLIFKKGNLEAFKTTLYELYNIDSIRAVSPEYAQYVTGLSNEVMRSDLSPIDKAHFAFVCNTLEPLGFELSSQLANVEDPSLRIFLSLPLFNNNQHTPNDDIYEKVSRVLIDSPDAALSLLKCYNDKIPLFRYISGKLTALMGNISQKYQDSEKAQALEKMSEDVNAYASQVSSAEDKKRKRPDEFEAIQEKRQKRLKIPDPTETDPRKNWKYNESAIMDGSCNATEEQLKDYKAVGNFVQEMIDKGYVSPSEASSALYVIRGYEILHEHNADICREILESSSPINYSTRYKVSRDRDILLHPEKSDLNLECRANNFYNILMASFAYVRDSNDIVLKVDFIRAAFASHVPCFEARSTHMDQWREDASKKHLAALKEPKTILTKTAEQNIMDLSHALLRRDELGVSQVRSQQRIHSLKKRLSHLTNGTESQKGIHSELSWAFNLLQTYLETDIEAYHSSHRTHGLIAQELRDILGGKEATDKIIQASDIDRYLQDILCWDINEQGPVNDRMETEE